VGEVDGNDAGSADVNEQRASGRYIGGRPMPARCPRRVMTPTRRSRSTRP